MSEESQLKWYVIRAVSGQEKKVKGYLEQEIARQALEHLIPQVLIPMEKVIDVKSIAAGKKPKVKEKNFFPGYILINADVNNSTVKHVLSEIPGFIGFLGNEQKGTMRRDPVPLRDHEVRRLLGQVDTLVDAEATLEVPFTKGEPVRVMDGPFNGFTGVVEEIFDERKKLNVTVKIFGRNTPVELSYGQVEKNLG
jgi:transcriptional antiterminator NusG